MRLSCRGPVSVPAPRDLVGIVDPDEQVEHRPRPGRTAARRGPWCRGPRRRSRSSRTGSGRERPGRRRVPCPVHLDAPGGEAREELLRTARRGRSPFGARRRGHPRGRAEQRQEHRENGTPTCQYGCPPGLPRPVRCAGPGCRRRRNRVRAHQPRRGNGRTAPRPLRIIYFLCFYHTYDSLWTRGKWTGPRIRSWEPRDPSRGSRPRPQRSHEPVETFSTTIARHPCPYTSPTI